LLDETPSHAVDEIVRDACNEQRGRGLIPRVGDVRSYVQGIVERMDRKEPARAPQRDAKPAPRLLNPHTDQGALEGEYKKRLARKGHEALPGAWRIDRTPTNKLISPKKLRSKGEKLLAARIRLIGKNPEWSAKFKRINPQALAGNLGEEKRLAAARAYMQVIEDSNRVFGDWKKERSRPIFLDGGKA
jgi:hypothetical protein